MMSNNLEDGEDQAQKSSKKKIITDEEAKKMAEY